MRISDWSSDVCSSDLATGGASDGSAGAPQPCSRKPAMARTVNRPRHRRSVRKIRDRKSVVLGKSVSVRVALGGLRIITKQKTNKQQIQSPLYTIINYL